MSRKRKSGFFTMLLLVILLSAGAYFIYHKFFAAVHLKDKAYVYLYIGRHDSFDDVLSQVEDLGLVQDPDAFAWLAKRMNLPANIHPGRYRITNGMNMRQIVNLIRYDKHEKVKLSYNSQIRDMDDFIRYTDEKLELEEDELVNFLSDEKKLNSNFGLDPENSFAMLLPATYEVGWAISAEELFSIIREKFNRTWNKARVAKANKLGYSIAEVTTLASIVQSESGIESEQKKIAGVYVNRLLKGMPLQADPTLKFANKTYDAQRVLDSDKLIDSPYNTYKYKGLPPGPICIVTPQAIDATLNYERHNFIYFCAKPELNGYSSFSSSYEQHRRCALEYRKALDRMGISR